MQAPSLSNNLRDHMFVLAWIVLAVVAKYSIALTAAPPKATIDQGVATAAPATTALAGAE